MPVLAALALVLAAAGTALSTTLGTGASPTAVRAAAATAGCGKAPTLASGTHTIQSSGQNRSYILRVPANYDNSRPYRLVFGFHWVGGTMNDVDSGGTDGYNWSYYGLRRLADSANNGTIFVAPQGINNGWANSNGQDVTFVDDMVGQLESGLCVDTTQVFSSGFSYGGSMTYALACARPTVFRAVAVYSGANLSGCSGGTQPVAYMGLHGIRDNVLPIANGRSLRDTFVRNNGCTPQNPPEPAYGSLTHIITAYSGCRSGYPVVWAAFDGAGHDPGPIDGSTGDGWRTWTSGEVWKFFTQFDSSTPPTSQPPTSQPPTTPPAGNRQIVGQQSNRCIDINNSSTANGTQAALWDCNGGSNQQWSYTSGKQLMVYGSKCLDASGQGTANGTAAVIWDCNGQANQQWNLNSNGTITGVQSGLCLDASGQGTANGTKIQLWTCTGGSNQQWSLRS
ncbi:ricin-type beta-trefoil lectin domain protein [Streptomyces cocklensis]|jgi:poly(3-hydroxybutyrate) depolymerase|nr:ricin-type beta-trefoil lectin domain protein [Actinacidiphila cocklensis]MDD1059951.1 ricin-type beta-trefoil lectin domain protein [Actinacidiphila cocklensis]WSX81567.1 ricin-type beta-trefoil lectin domain protein [Streptomyces sp. NBC_00899]WSX82210.1 ricin-type beta-trefoil lectin domain protein [Streptomyces sp. NBC_00899]